ncbi:hypothetical protein GGD81_000060 [Rhodobium orientis]|uniref:DUF1468 domain-containing protein n=1 Tax=Rhodobium orientis TaxID=34017 RepID=A0A327K434_9HYPH|nr:tripartite tricarboxylate transporter TctB family protein [Rhodobium orientis]MBB4301045.1 hypothetical protein [Rhodobium orientis]MBK5949713.1 hypothetical protein [Rhodobium orientis]RAI30168.1 hypothetical protein CH339_01180 [Rhodobium orientis]
MPSTGFLSVRIDFSQSHLFFPTIIHWILLVLAIAIALVYGPGLIREFREGKRRLLPKGSDVDVLRLGGTLILTVAYFVSMDWVGQFFPNRGLGFLIMSVPFMFGLSLLYVHGLTWRRFAVIGLSSTISPTVAWYTLAQLFHITLP